jgi:hypothetical protein
MLKQKIYIKEDSLDDPRFPEAERKRLATPKKIGNYIGFDPEPNLCCFFRGVS